MSDYVTLVIAGASEDLGSFTSKKGNTCFGYMDVKADGTEYLPQYGVPIPPIAENLPSTVEFRTADGEFTLPLSRPEKAEPGTQKVSGRTQSVSVGGKPYVAQVTVSVRKNGDWNLKASLWPYKVPQPKKATRAFGSR